MDTPAREFGHMQYMSAGDPDIVILVWLTQWIKALSSQSQMNLLWVMSMALSDANKSGSGERSWFPDISRISKLAGKSPGERTVSLLSLRLSPSVQSDDEILLVEGNSGSFYSDRRSWRWESPLKISQHDLVSWQSCNIFSPRKSFSRLGSLKGHGFVDKRKSDFDLKQNLEMRYLEKEVEIIQIF